MKFDFRLKSVLNIKIQMEDILKTELGEALALLEMENKELGLLVSQFENYTSEYRGLLKEWSLVTEINSYNTYFGKQKEKIEVQEENINKARKNVDKIREELIKVAKEKDMLEKLHKKKMFIFNEVQLNEEQKLIDEIISYNYNAKPVEVK